VQPSATTSIPFISRWNKDNLEIRQSKLRSSKKLCWRLALCNLGCSKKITKNKQVNPSWTSTPSSKSLMYKKDKKTSSLQIMLHRYAPHTCVRFGSAQSGDCVLPLAGARRYEANHRRIEGEHWAQCARVRR
jgi:hypothetical protein